MSVEITDVVLGELVDLIARATGSDEERRHSYKVEVGLEVIGFHYLIFADRFRLDFHTIKRVHYTLVSELSLDQFEVLVLAKR